MLTISDLNILIGCIKGGQVRRNVYYYYRNRYHITPCLQTQRLVHNGLLKYDGANMFRLTEGGFAVIKGHIFMFGIQDIKERGSA